MRRLFYLCLLFVWGGDFSCLGQTKIAVLTSDSSLEIVQDFLTVHLSTCPDVEVFERADIQRVLDERKLQVDGFASMQQAGHLIGADGIVHLEAGQSNILAQVVAVKTGVILDYQLLSVSIENPDEWAQGYAKLVSAVLPKLKVPREKAVAISISNFRSPLKNAESQELEDILPLLLKLKLSAAPELFVLDRDRMDSLMAESEFSLAEGTSFWTSGFVIDGQINPDGKKEGQSVIRVRMAKSGLAAPITVQVEGADETISDLADRLVEQICAELRVNHSGLLTDSGAEAAYYYEEALWAFRNRMYKQALAAADAAYALGLQNEEVMLMRVKASADLCRRQNKLYRSSSSGGECFYSRICSPPSPVTLEYAQRLLGLLETYLDQQNVGKLTRKQAKMVADHLGIVTLVLSRVYYGKELREFRRPVTGEVYRKDYYIYEDYRRETAAIRAACRRIAERSGQDVNMWWYDRSMDAVEAYLRERSASEKWFYPLPNWEDRHSDAAIEDVLDVCDTLMEAGSLDDWKVGLQWKMILPKNSEARGVALNEGFKKLVNLWWQTGNKDESYRYILSILRTMFYGTGHHIYGLGPGRYAGNRKFDHQLIHTYCRGFMTLHLTECSFVDPDGLAYLNRYAKCTEQEFREMRSEVELAVGSNTLKAKRLGWINQHLPKTDIPEKKISNTVQYKKKKEPAVDLAAIEAVRLSTNDVIRSISLDGLVTNASISVGHVQLHNDELWADLSCSWVVTTLCNGEQVFDGERKKRVLTCFESGRPVIKNQYVLEHKGFGKPLFCVTDDRVFVAHEGAVEIIDRWTGERSVLGLKFDAVERLWSLGSDLYLFADQALVRFNPRDESSEILASSRRRPAMSLLDDRQDYDIYDVNLGPGGSLIVSTSLGLYEYLPGGLWRLVKNGVFDSAHQAAGFCDFRLNEGAGGVDLVYFDRNESLLSSMTLMVGIKKNYGRKWLAGRQGDATWLTCSRSKVLTRDVSSSRLIRVEAEHGKRSDVLVLHPESEIRQLVCPSEGLILIAPTVIMWVAEDKLNEELDRESSVGGDEKAPCRVLVQSLKPASSDMVRKGMQDLAFKAVMHNQLSLLKSLIGKGLDVNGLDETGKGLLVEAVKLGHSGLVSVLLAAGADHTVKDQAGNPLLVYPVRQGNKAVYQLLVDAGANVDQYDAKGRPLISLAASAGNLRMLKALIASGADVNHVGEDGKPPIYITVGKGNLSLTKVLVEAGASLNLSLESIDPVIFESVRFFEVAKYLLESGAEVEVCNHEKWTLLMAAVDANNMELIHYLLDEKGVDVAVKTERNATAFSLCMPSMFNKRFKEEIFDVLLDGLNAQDPAQVTEQLGIALETAVRCPNSVELMEIFLEKGAPIDGVPGSDKSPLRTVVGWGSTFNSAAIDCLIEHGLRMEGKEKYASVIPNFLFNHGEQYTQQGKDKVWEYVDKFLLSGADINGEGTEFGQRSALCEALFGGRIERALRLVDRGADPSLVSGVDQRSPLGRALTSGKSTDELIQRMLSKGMSADVVLGVSADPAIYSVVDCKKYGVLELLLQAGAKVDLCNGRGESALMKAVLNQDLKAAEVLCQYGADPHLKNLKGESPVTIANQKKDKDMKELLKAALK